MPRSRKKEEMSLPTQSGQRAGEVRFCESPGCIHVGAYPAPKDRDRLREYYWFCLDHVRQYNRAWDYYKGMKPEEIELHLKEDTVWQRPSWPLGLGQIGLRGNDYEIHDFGLFGKDGPFGSGRSRQGASPSSGANPASGLSTAEEQALRILDLQYPLSWADVKARYKTLVKKLHPDANGGDPVAEEQLKQVNFAYSTLKSSPLRPE